ncbi:MAG: hypothetical protein ACYTBV_04990 [Planctomycetota bacterium]
MATRISNWRDKAKGKPMAIIPSDTTIEAMAKQGEILRGLDISSRAEMTFELSDNLRQIVEAGVRDRYPDLDEKDVNREVMRLMLGEKLFGLAFRDTGAVK